MNNKKTIAQFMRFMKQNRVWAAFKINIKDWSLQDGMTPQPYKTSGGVNVSLYLKGCPPISYVMRSFSWALSPQGHDYWSNINYKWEDERLSYKLAST